MDNPPLISRLLEQAPKLRSFYIAIDGLEKTQMALDLFKGSLSDESCRLVPQLKFMSFFASHLDNFFEIMEAVV